MNAPKIHNTKKGPEAKIQEDLLRFLTFRGWYCRETHGNMYMNGFPDVYITHHSYGTRWVEVKNPKSYSFTAAQIREFPLLSAHGTGIWILTEASENEYKKLWQPPNWYIYYNLLNHRGCV